MRDATTRKNVAHSMRVFASTGAVRVGRDYPRRLQGISTVIAPRRPLHLGKDSETCAGHMLDSSGASSGQPSTRAPHPSGPSTASDDVLDARGVSPPTLELLSSRIGVDAYRALIRFSDLEIARLRVELRPPLLQPLDQRHVGATGRRA